MPSRLELIPVIDLMDGQVVHARLGRRTFYQPLRSPLADHCSDPLRVAAGLLALHPFRHLYIADLDAITGRGSHARTIAAIRELLPGVELWIDSGLRTLADAPRAPDVPVLGSESLDATPPGGDPAASRRWVLSLDFRGGKPLGAASWVEQTRHWPPDVIVMDLDRVGSDQGPDLRRLADLRDRSPLHRWHAAGGVRDATDLAALALAGAHGVLLASALHDGRLGAEELRRFAAGG